MGRHAKSRLGVDIVCFAHALLACTSSERRRQKTVADHGVLQPTVRARQRSHSRGCRGASHAAGHGCSSSSSFEARHVGRRVKRDTLSVHAAHSASVDRRVSLASWRQSQRCTPIAIWASQLRCDIAQCHAPGATVAESQHHPAAQSEKSGPLQTSRMASTNQTAGRTSDLYLRKIRSTGGGAGALRTPSLFPPSPSTSPIHSNQRPLLLRPPRPKTWKLGIPPGLILQRLCRGRP